jgi:hypothetical protein
MDRSAVQCKPVAYATLVQISYDSEGGVVTSMNKPESLLPDLSFEDAIPDSLGETIYNRICQWYGALFP